MLHCVLSKDTDASLTMPSMGVAKIFQRGGHTESYRGHSPDCHLNIIGCLLTKRLTRGAHMHPRTPLAMPLPSFHAGAHISLNHQPGVPGKLLTGRGWVGVCPGSFL